MKKLAVFIMMFSALAISMVPAIASAFDVPPGAVHGAYEVFATGTCTHSGHEFTLNQSKPTDVASANIVNNTPGIASPTVSDAWVSTYLGRGTFTFYGDGTGAMRMTQYCILPVGSPTAWLDQKVGPPISAAAAPFEYWLAKDGTITVRIPAVGLWLSGTLSKDHKTMTLFSSMQQQTVSLDPPHYQVCTIGRMLFRADDQISAPHDNRMIR